METVLRVPGESSGVNWRTDQLKKKLFFRFSPRKHPLREIFFFAETNKNHFFAEGFREISRCVGKT